MDCGIVAAVEFAHSAAVHLHGGYYTLLVGSRENLKSGRGILPLPLREDEGGRTVSIRTSPQCQTYHR